MRSVGAGLCSTRCSDEISTRGRSRAPPLQSAKQIKITSPQKGADRQTRSAPSIGFQCNYIPGRSVQGATEEILAQLDGLSGWEVSETDGVCGVTANLAEGADAKAVCGKLTLAFAAKSLPVIEMRMKKANLEDVFLELTEAGAAEAPEETEPESEVDGQ